MSSAQMRYLNFRRACGKGYARLKDGTNAAVAADAREKDRAAHLRAASALWWQNFVHHDWCVREGKRSDGISRCTVCWAR